MTFKKTMFIVFGFLLLNALVFAKRIGVVEEILNPNFLRVSHDTLFISDQYYVNFYSIERLNLLGKTGGKGEGPKEYQFQPAVRVFKDRILVFAAFKIDLYTFKGELISEKKYDRLLFDVGYANGSYIVSIVEFQQGKTDFNLLNSNLKTIKTINSVKNPQPSPLTKIKTYLVEPLNKFQCFDNKIYLVSSNQEGIFFTVFDNQGTLVKTIRRDSERIIIPEAYKIKKFDEFKSIPAVKKRWQGLSRLYDYTFPKYFPAIEDFRVTDGKIYIKTYKSLKSNVEYLVLDLDGKLLGKYFLPDIQEKFYDIKNNYFYYLQEDEEAETWEIHAVKIQ